MPRRRRDCPCHWGSRTLKRCTLRVDGLGIPAARRAGDALAGQDRRDWTKPDGRTLLEGGRHSGEALLTTVAARHPATQMGIAQENQPGSAGSRVDSVRPVLLSIAVVAVLVLCVLPLTEVALGGRPSFVSASLAVVVTLNLLSTVLLLTHFHDTGSRRALVLASAFIFSLVVMTGYGAAFRG